MNIVKHMLLCIVFCYAHFFSIAQVSNHLFTFESDTFFQSDYWRCDASKFTVEEGRLRSDCNLLNDTFGIATSIMNRDEAEWTVDVELDFATSSANYMEVYFWSDDSCLRKHLNALYLKIGGAKDRLELIQIIDGVTTTLSISESNVTHGITGFVTMRMEESGKAFCMFYDVNRMDTIWHDSLHIQRKSQSYYTGISIRQSTTSFHGKHYIDNLYYGPFRRDSVAPNLLSVGVEQDSILRLVFDEEVNINQMLPSQFVVKPNQKLPEKMYQNGDTIWLHFLEHFETGHLTLTAQNVSDYHGNAASTINFPFEHVVLEIAGRYDVVVSEIYADFSPSVGLPPFEYLELTNVSKKNIDLLGWKISDGSRTCELKAYTLRPDSIVVICDEKVLYQFGFIDNVIGVKQFISLNNAGDSIWLKNEIGTDIHKVFYASDWHKPIWKSDGGWSLEMIDLEQPCKQQDNWSSCTDEVGGTPGVPNSIAGKVQDFEPPAVTEYRIDGKVLNLTLDEVVVNDTFDASNWVSLERSVVAIQKIDDYNLQVMFKEETTEGILYTLHLYGLEDCLGNTSEQLTIRFGVGVKPEVGSVVINEVMYDVSEGCAEYIEIVNTTDAIIDLSDLYIAIHDQDTQFEQLYQVQQTSRLLLPLGYVVICTDTLHLKSCKSNAINMVEMPRFPTLVNTSGNVALVSQLGHVLDIVYYSDDMHFPLLDDAKDVSLERFAPHIEEEKWNSAASTVNYGSPGFINSSTSQSSRKRNEMHIQTDPVSPDLDGYNDRLLVEVSMDTESLAHLRIYDLAGHLIAFPINTSLIHGKTVLEWDCLSTDGHMVKTGMYIADFEAIDLAGNKTHSRSVFTVVR